VETVFLKLLNMSLTGCVMILAVIAARLLLKKAPRWSICLLWGLVALRLICPFTIKSNLSLIRNSEPIIQEIISEQLPTAPLVTEQVQYEYADCVPENLKIPQQTVEIVPEKQAPNVLEIAGYVWLSGVALMLTYFMISYLTLKRRVRTATRLEKNIRQSEYVTSPFVLGVFRPIIYLPYGLKQKHQDHIIAHERSHIGRGDHLIKPLGFAVLSVHWFNPLVWLAYILLCRDIEAACDERVISKMTHEQRQSYSATLLHYSMKCRRIAACPVAFGETGIKGRIKNVMNYKKPVLWVVILALLAGTATGVCFLTERPEEPPTETVDLVAVARMEMETLLDKLLDHEDRSVASDPVKCAKALPEIYQELLSYDDLALSYFIPKLRKADIHSYRDYLMVYVCAELTGVKSNYAGGGWWEMPQLWISEYDRVLMGDTADTRLRPGRYMDFLALSNDENPYYGEFWEGPSDVTDYYVTADGLTRVYRTYVIKEHDNYHCHQQTAQEKVQWQWESANGVGAPQTERAQEIRKALNQSLKFLEGTEMESLITDENCLLQPLERGACIVQSNGELFWLQSDYWVRGYNHIFYVKRLSHESDYWFVET